MIDYFWSRTPGKFVDKRNGEVAIGATFTGTVREWYETLIEVMIDVCLKSIEVRGGKPISNVSWNADPNIATIVDCSVLAKPLKTDDPPLGTIGVRRPIVVYNTPVFGTFEMRNTGKMELVMTKDDGTTERLGSITVIDAIIIGD